MVGPLFKIIEREGRKIILKPSRLEMRQGHPISKYIRENGVEWYLLRFKPGYYFNLRRSNVNKKQRFTPSSELEARAIDGRYDGKQYINSFIIQVFGKESDIVYSAVESIGFFGDVPPLNSDYIERTLARMPNTLKIRAY